MPGKGLKGVEDFLSCLNIDGREQDYVGQPRFLKWNFCKHSWNLQLELIYAKLACLCRYILRVSLSTIINT